MDIKTKGFTMPNGDTHIFIPPSPTETERGGIKAKAKTTETVEVAVGDDEKLYIPGTDTTLTVENNAADAKATGEAIKELKNETSELKEGLSKEKTDREQADISLQKDISGKLSEPVEGLAVGKYFRVAQIDENGHAVLEAVDLPIASENQFGVVRVQSVGAERGVCISSEGFLSTQFSSASQIDKRTNFNNSITPHNLDYAVKAAMCDGKGEPWTAEEQAAARERMSVENGSDFELLVDATLEEEANTFVVKFPKPVRECLYHVWFFNNNGESVIARTKCIDSDRPGDFHLLKYTGNILDGNGYVVNGYFRYNGNVFNHNIVGYASESWYKGWTTDYVGNGATAWMNYPTTMVLRKVDGLLFQLLDTSHVLNAGAVIRVWGR